ISRSCRSTGSFKLAIVLILARWSPRAQCPRFSAIIRHSSIEGLIAAAVRAAPERADESLQLPVRFALGGSELAHFSPEGDLLFLHFDEHLHTCKDQLADRRDLAVMPVDS